jgi:hypothetical protein
MTNQYSLPARVLYFRIFGVSGAETEVNYKNTVVNIQISSRSCGVVKEGEPTRVLYLRTDSGRRVLGRSVREPGSTAVSSGSSPSRRANIFYGRTNRTPSPTDGKDESVVQIVGTPSQPRRSLLPPDVASHSARYPRSVASHRTVTRGPGRIRHVRAALGRLDREALPNDFNIRTQ